MAHRRPPLMRALQLNTAVLVVEIAAGIGANSFSLIMDGIHNLSDEVALLLLVFAYTFRAGLSGRLLRFANLLHGTPELARRHDHDLDLVVGRREFGLNGRPCWRIARRYPGIPDRIHLSEIRHVGNPDVGGE